MIQRLTRYPLIGLSIAIAAGYVLAHLVLRVGGYVWDDLLEDFLDKNGWIVADLAIAAGLLFLVVWKRRNILIWFRNHTTTVSKVLFSLIVGGLFAAEQGGKTYTAVASSGGNDYAARLAANRVAVKDLAFSSLLFFAFFYALKLITVRNERRAKRQRMANEPHK